MKMIRPLRYWALFALLTAATALSSCGHKAAAVATTGDSSAEPDKVLYETSMAEISNGKYEIGRLGLQTLMNTYPDSEYLAKAKLGIADSYYKEGGVSGMTHAAAEYEDFITFFPFLDEAAYAQMQVGMAHYNRMEKPDRDHTEALAAESAFQVLLEKYPNAPVAEQGRQRLREVQEVLAEGEMRTAEFYFIRGADRAAVSRLLHLTKRYPLYSRADQAQWDLAAIYERHGGGREQAIQYYANIVRDYPLSPFASDAKEKLEKYGASVPDPNPEAVARMKKESEADRDHPGFFGHALGMLKSGPDVSMAAKFGEPTMTPDNDDTTSTVLGLPTPTGTAGVRTGVTAQAVTPSQK